MATKTCGNCGNEKLMEDYRSVIDKRKKEGVLEYKCSWCRQCEKNKSLARYNANKAKLQAQNRKWKEENKEKVKLNRKEYCEKNKEYIKQRYKKYCDNNREKINQIARDYKNNNLHVKVKHSLASRLRECIKKNKRTHE
jgi:hypothetical protein